MSIFKTVIRISVLFTFSPPFLICFNSCIEYFWIALLAIGMPHTYHAVTIELLVILPRKAEPDS
jgi:hypothetical protein